jgi:hypothetical protein
VELKMSEDAQEDVLTGQDGDLSRLHICSEDIGGQNGPLEDGHRRLHSEEASHGSNEDIVNGSREENEPTKDSSIAVNTSDSIEITYESYSSELQMPDIMRLIQASNCTQFCGSGMFYPGSGSDQCSIPDPDLGSGGKKAPDPRSDLFLNKGY